MAGDPFVDYKVPVNYLPHRLESYDAVHRPPLLSKVDFLP